MPVSDRTLRRLLQKELENLEAKLQGLEAEDNKIKQQIAVLSGEARNIRALLGSQGMDAWSAAEKANDQAEDDKPGFRDSIRDVLRTAPARGLQPKEVARALEERGIPSGKLSMASRVSNELWRLRKSGHVGKRKGGRYVLKAKSDSASSDTAQNGGDDS